MDFFNNFSLPHPPLFLVESNMECRISKNFMDDAKISGILHCNYLNIKWGFFYSLAIFITLHPSFYCCPECIKNVYIKKKENSPSPTLAHIIELKKGPTITNTHVCVENSTAYMYNKTVRDMVWGWVEKDNEMEYFFFKEKEKNI